MSRPGTDLEQLVARLERALAPTGAKVTSPDKLWHASAGEYREIDVTIRMALGSAAVVVILECRDRSRVQDVEWIEQLAQKRNNVNASKAVAISSQGFTDGARKTALALGIDLRTVDEVDADVIADWLRVHRLTVTRPDFQIHDVGVVLDGTPDMLRRVAALPAVGGDSRAFLWGNDPAPKNVRELFALLSAHGWMRGIKPDPWEGLPKDGTRVRRKLATDVRELQPRIRFSWNGFEGNLAKLFLILDLWEHGEEVPLTRMVSYRKDEDAFIEAAEYLMDVEGQPEILMVQRDLRTGQESLTRHPVGADRELPMIWMKYQDYPLDPPSAPTTD